MAATSQQTCSQPEKHTERSPKSVRAAGEDIHDPDEMMREGPSLDSILAVEFPHPFDLRRFSSLCNSTLRGDESSNTLKGDALDPAKDLKENVVALPPSPVGFFDSSPSKLRTAVF